MTVPEVSGYTELRPMPDGRSFEVFLGRAADGSEVVIRVYGAGVRARGPEAPGVQGAVLRLLRGVLPVPPLVEVRRDLLVTGRLPGVPMVQALATADRDLQHRLGQAAGEVLGRLAGLAMSGAGGFMDDRLRVGCYEEGAESLLTWLDRYLPGSALTQLSPAQLGRLRVLCEGADRLLAVSHRAVLVHGDFSPRNLLCDPDAGVVTGVIDWEFAHAGHPVEDLGKWLRADPASVVGRAAVEAMIPWLPRAEQASIDEVSERARAADLYALIESASRRGASPSTERAWELLDQITSAGCLLGDTHRGGEHPTALP